jgi:ABC-type polysaccharide/polyol phosphate transport system ATPase subunit
MGIVGPNGSGKSTLLQIVSGILSPTSGRVIAQGRIAALLELGAGFNPEFTGRENVLLSAEILGMRREEITQRLPDIENFAGIGQFIDRPVKEYSTGMFVRLAFATAIHVEPEVLIIDEALSVGDAAFANRCIHKLEQIKAQGVTVLFCSHDLGLVKRLCDQAIFLLNGRIIESGHPSNVVNRYVGSVLERERANETDAPLPGGSFRHGDGKSRIEKIALLDEKNLDVKAIEAQRPATIRIHVRVDIAQPEIVVGILVRNRLGADVFGTNTRIEQLDIGPFEAGEQFSVDFRFDCQLTRGEYTLTVATQHRDGFSQDWIDDAVEFRVVDHRDRAGVANLQTKVTWRRE